MIIPDTGDFRKPLFYARNLASLGVPIFCCKLDDEGNPVRAYDWQKTEPGEDSVRAIDRWQPGWALGAVTGSVFDVVDVDPRNGGLDSWPLLLARLADEPPELFGIAATPSRGAHFWIASQGVAKTKLAKGIDLQAAGGFVFIAPTVRPSKWPADEGELRPYTWVMPVDWNASPWLQEPRQAFLELPWDLNGSSASPERPRSGRRTTQELIDEVLAAEAGEQRNALLRLVREFEMRGIPREGIIDTLRNFLPRVPAFDPDSPWYPARGGNPDKWIMGLFTRSGRIVPDASDDEMDGIKEAQPNVVTEEDPEETAFWESRPVLEHIFLWSRARLASPWAVLGEVMAEAVCHTPPGFQLPPTTGGEGTLNMLIAIVGKSGSGKNAATATAHAAFKWEGVMGIIDKLVPRVPIGSGEGLVKSFGFNAREKDTGRTKLVPTDVSAIITIPEIDTFSAINARSGSTISPELRKLYSGETLGFGWADVSKRVIIPAHTYRSCVIAGVQPGRGEVILNDVDGGFAQRWLWLPANDPSAPDKEYGDPPVYQWEPPGLIPELAYSEGPHLMKLFPGAAMEMRAARLRELRGLTDDMESHALYTRLKVAAALALLDGHDRVREEDWTLSGFVMRISNRTREYVQKHLAQKAHDANIAAGRAKGVQNEVAETTAFKKTKQRIAEWILTHLDTEEFTSFSDLKRDMAGRDKDHAEEVLANLVGLSRIEMVESVARNKVKSRKFRRI